MKDNAEWVPGTFFEFSRERSPDAVHMTIAVPETHTDVLDALAQRVGPPGLVG